MESQLYVLIFMGAGLAYALSQWQVWRARALYQLGKTKEAGLQVHRANEMMNNFDDERRIQHEAMMEAFDYINDNGPFGTHDIGLMQVKGVLIRAIQTSTYGRGK